VVGDSIFSIDGCQRIEITGYEGAGTVMKVLVATSASQGTRDNDYHWCVEGELVWISEPCRKDRKDPDGGCGCGRGFGGLASHRATTTAAVKDIPEFTQRDLEQALRSSLGEQGWPTDHVVEIAGMLADVAAAFPEGTVVERRLWDIHTRTRP
jgi:hypothetical protein